MSTSSWRRTLAAVAIIAVVVAVGTIGIGFIGLTVSRLDAGPASDLGVRGTPAPTAPVADATDALAVRVSVPDAGAAIRPRPVMRGRDLRVLESQWFTIGYDERMKNPAWVTYDLDGPIVHRGPSPDRPMFTTDMRTAAHVANRDYTGTGYDRGHLCPAYDMWSRHGAEAFIATFTCSNIVPQPHAMNAGTWEDIEAAIAGRDGHGDGWAASRGPLAIVAGPVYDDRPGRFRNGTAIPASCFKVIISRRSPPDAIAFMVPATPDVRGPIRRWITSIARIERETGLDILAGEAAVWRDALAARVADAPW